MFILLCFWKIDYIHGRKAVLIVYDGDTELERVLLSDLETRERMHSVMKEKGFKLIEENLEEEEEVEDGINEEKKEEDDDEDEDDDDSEDDEDDEEEGEL